ncbi:MAG: c-type cytochrome [Akkermansiaceae bacterium]
MSPAVAHPIIPGLPESKLKPDLKGMVLVEEMNCVACHQSDASFAKRSKKAPRLANIGSRVDHKYIEKFISNPHETKPGTTMPDVLSGKDKMEREEIAKSITHFLLSKRANNFKRQVPDAIAAERGNKLFHARGCVACHSPRDENGKELLKETSAPLGDLHKKYSGESLLAFLRNPHAVRPSGRMPSPQLASNELQDITHYLLRDTRVSGNLHYSLYEGNVWEGIGSDEVRPVKAGHVKDFVLEGLGRVPREYAVEYEGWINLAEPGDYTFFLTLNGGSLEIDGKKLFSEKPSNMRSPKSFEETTKLSAGKKKLKLTYYHTGRDRKLSFEMQGPGFKRATIPSSMLTVWEKPPVEHKALEVDAALAATGKKHFKMQGCANCHTDMNVQPNYSRSFAELTGNKGCLSEAKSKALNYHLSSKQRELINQFLPKSEKVVLTPIDNIHKTLTTFNCTACHEREGLGGIDPARNSYFTGTHPELGEQGRIPPTLSHVGAKLTPEWIRSVLLEGKTQRDYINSKMPQYGAENVGHLVELFGKVDKLEDAKIPKIANIRESKRAGYQMMGTKGFSCIACHHFNGKNPGNAGALDLAHVTKRLQKDWFHLFMRNPSRFHTTGIMPSFWPGGKSIRPDVLGGDSSQQIEALWAYLGDGARAKKPEGLMRQLDELRVFDTAEMVRGRGTPAGFRAIGVGYPERINLAFDSEEMALRLLWKGAFAKVNNGSFRVAGTDTITFPKGIPFHRLKSMDAHWPYKGKTNYTFPQDHGYQYRGYHLDELRRPTFHYHYGEVKVEDFTVAIEKEKGKAKFRRTFSFDAAKAQDMFYFRAGSGKKITPQSPGSYTVDGLTIRVTGGQKAVIREGDPGDLLIPLELPKGKSTLTLEYQW